MPELRGQNLTRGAEAGVERALNPARPRGDVFAGEVDAAFGFGGKGDDALEIAGLGYGVGTAGEWFVGPGEGSSGFCVVFDTGMNLFEEVKHSGDPLAG